jgi:two-component system LytT family response regulator
MKLKIKAFLVDDEPAIASVLENLFRLYLPQIEVIGKSFDWKESLEAVQALKPDVVFLDIRMPGGTGFDFLDQFGSQRSFEVIFVTGFEDYALKAIKADAIDYILKPIDEEELIEACRRLEIRLASRKNIDRQGSDIKDDFFLLPQKDKKRKVPFSDIVFARSENNYSNLVLKSGDEVMVSKTLKQLESELGQPSRFIRISREHLVNMQEIAGYSMYHPFEIKLSNGVALPLSRRRRTEVIKWLANR